MKHHNNDISKKKEFRRDQKSSASNFSALRRNGVAGVRIAGGFSKVACGSERIRWNATIDAGMEKQEKGRESGLIDR